MKLLIIQTISLLLLVYVGWDIVIIFIEPKGENWMWVMDLNFSFIGMMVLILIGHYMKNVVNKRLEIYVFLFQLLIIIIMWFIKLDVRPLRYSYLLISGIIVFTMPYATKFYLKARG